MSTSYDVHKSGPSRLGPLANGTSPAQNASLLVQFGNGPVHHNGSVALNETGHHHSNPDTKQFRSSSPGQLHGQRHRRHSDDIIPVTSSADTAINPSFSVQNHLSSVNSETTTDGAIQSRAYNVSNPDSKSRSSNVKLVTYKPLADPEQDMLADREARREAEMTQSQQEFATDLDAKVKALYHTRKVSDHKPRMPKTQTPPTKADLKSIMNMKPESGRKVAKSTPKRLPQNTVHGVPWDIDSRMQPEVTQRARDDAHLINKHQKLNKSKSDIQLVSYRRVEISPPIPEEEPEDVEVGQDDKETPKSQRRQLKTSGSTSTTSSFEFRSSVSYSGYPLSPTQETVEQMDLDSSHTANSTSRKFEKFIIGDEDSYENDEYSNIPKKEQGEVIFRHDLADTHLDDVTVFGQHFDPSQLTQERMEDNTGDLSMVGLNAPQLRPLKAKRGEKQDAELTVPSPASLKLAQKKKARAQSESASPKRGGLWKKNKPEMESDSLRTALLKYKDSSNTNEPYWERDMPGSVSLPASALCTPTRTRMHHISYQYKDYPQRGIDDSSMPELFRPSASFHGKEKTPDSGTSDDERPRKRHSIGFALGRKFASMRDLFGTKEKRSPVKRTSWFFSGPLSHAPSEPSVSTLTEKERKDMLEDVEIMPGSMRGIIPRRQPQWNKKQQSIDGNPLGHLFIPPKSQSDVSPAGASHVTSPNAPHLKPSADGFEERSVDMPSSDQQKVMRQGSNSEQEMASESDGGFVTSSVSIHVVKSPLSPDSALKKAGYFTDSPSEDAQIQKMSGEDGAQCGTSLSTSEKMPSSGSKLSKDKVDSKLTKKGKAKQKPLSAKAKEKDKVASSKKQEPQKVKEERSSFGRFSKERTGIHTKSSSPRSISPANSSLSSGSRPPSFRSSANRQQPSSTTVDGAMGSKVKGKGDAAVDVSNSPFQRSYRGGNKPSPSGSGRGSGLQPPSSVITSTSHSRSPPSEKKGSPTSRAISSPRGSYKSVLTTPTISRKTSSPKTSVASANPPEMSHLKPSPTAIRRRSSAPTTSTSPLLSRKQPESKAKRTPVRPAPPPPLSLNNPPSAAAPISRTSSQASPKSASSSSTPRQRRKGISLPESPISPKKGLGSEPSVPPSIGEEANTENRKTSTDHVQKLLTTVGEKLAPLSVSPEPPDPSSETEFKRLPTPEIQVSSEDISAPAMGGLRPKHVMSTFSGSNLKNSGKKLPAKESTAKTKVKKKSVETTEAAKTNKTSISGSLKKKESQPSAASSKSSGRKLSLSSLKSLTSGKKPAPTVSSKLPPLPPGMRKVKSESGRDRSASTVAVPSIRVNELRKSVRKMSAATIPESSKTLSLSPTRQSAVRSSIKVTGKLKKNNPMSPEHRKVSSLPRLKGDDPKSSPLHATIRPSSRQGTLNRSVRKPTRVAPVAPGRMPGRAASQKASVSAGNLNRDSSAPDMNTKRRYSAGNKSMRKMSGSIQPKSSVAGGTLNRGIANRSIRMSSSRKVSTMGTLPRSSVVSRLGTSVTTGNLQSSIARKSYKKTSSAKDIFAAFDEISNEAKGQM